MMVIPGNGMDTTLTLKFYLTVVGSVDLFTQGSLKFILFSMITYSFVRTLSHFIVTCALVWFFFKSEISESTFRLTSMVIQGMENQAYALEI